MDESIIDRIFSVAAAAWAAVAMLAVRLFHTWPLVMERLNERKRDSATEKADDWQRLRAERDYWRERHDECEAELDALKRENIELLGRAVRAEAAFQGYGDARQRIAIEEATKRNIALEGPTGGGK